jgi:hypothetical protein
MKKMKTIVKEYQGFKFEELEEKAKNTARSRHAECIDWDWWDFSLEQFVTDMEELGIDIEQTRGKKNQHEIHFSGFYSQGDGLAFSAGIDIPKFLKSHKATKEYWLLYTNLLRDNISLTVWVKESGRYFSMVSDFDLDIWNIGNDARANKIQKMSEDFTEWILDICRDHASDLYRELEKEYEYLLSDDQIIEDQECNEYWFDKNGRII